MTDSFLCFSKRRIVFRALSVLFLLVFTPATSVAQGNWWDRGKEFLKEVSPKPSPPNRLSTEEMGAGLKEALRVGTERVVGQLGRTDGFNADPAIHIPLPENFLTVQSVLNQVGMGAMLDDLELRLNRAAEAATPKAKELFWKSIGEMTLVDIKNIYSGPDDAATRYFRDKMSGSLAEEMRPVVDRSLTEVGAIQAYDKVMGQYRSFPFVPNVKGDLTGYVVNRGMDGIFHYLALEEAAIRQDPARRTTELLRRVFGAQ